MSLEFWLHAERFYESWLTILVSLIIVILITMILSYTYIRKENRKKILSAFTVVAVILGLIALGRHVRYASYLEQAMHVNPLIRDRTPAFIDYTYFSRNELSFYTGLNDLEALREMTLYEEELVEEEVEYLGEGKHTHYFEHDNGLQFRFNRTLVFSDEVDQAKLVGARFYLADDAFQEIGFMNPENVMFEHIIVPVSEEGKTFTPEDERDFMRIENVLDGWNF